MRLLVYEYLTGGGLWSDGPGEGLCHPLLAEGRAMIEAVSRDLHQVEDVQVVTFRDTRSIALFDAPGETVAIASAAHELAALADWAPRVDGVVLVAPEHGGRLLRRCRWVQQHGGRLLSPDPAFVEIAADKSRTACLLAAAGVPVPHALRLEPGEPIPGSFPFPAVLKPNDGVGALETHLLMGRSEAERMRGQYRDARRLEAFCPGTPASVVALCGPRRQLLLPPCQQRVTCGAQFHYLGGRFPLARHLAQRASRLARATFAALPRTRGFVGVDLLLGPAADGTDDVVLEVNPRLTTSYIGLRQGTSSNLAAAMLAIQRGDRYPLFFHGGVVEFEADGRIRRTSPSPSIA